MLLTKRRVKNIIALFFLIPLYGFFIGWMILALFFMSMFDAKKVLTGMTLQEAVTALGKPPDKIDGKTQVRWTCWDGDIRVRLDEQNRVVESVAFSPESPFENLANTVLKKMKWWR